MTPDPSVIAAVAARYNVPPAILMAVGEHSSAFAPGAVNSAAADAAGGVGAFRTSTAMLQAYGVKPEDISGNVAAQAEVAARALSALFLENGSWEKALSAYVSGDPNAYSSPTSSVGGWVYSVLGVAASDPSLGMQNYQPADPQAFSKGALDFQGVLEQFSSSGGVVTPQSVDKWRATAYQASQGAAYRGPTRSAPQITGRSADTNYGFQLEAMPFDKQYVGAVTEGFGDTSGPGGYREAGNDYGLPHGTAINAPVSGTLRVIDYGHGNTGLTAYIEMPNGWKVGIGHLANVSLQDGAQVRAGQAIATSGGVPGVDRSPGNTTGAHIEFQLIDPQGRFHDPHPLIVGAASGQLAPAPPAAASASASTQPQAPSTTPTAAQQQKPAPAEVGKFAAKLQANGIDPEHFSSNFGYYSALRRRLLAQNTDVEDYAPVAGQDQPTMQAYVRAQPHPAYPELTAGAYADTHSAASLHSVRYQQRTPYPAEVARLTAAKSDWSKTESFYKPLPELASSSDVVRRQGGPF